MVFSNCSGMSEMGLARKNIKTLRASPKSLMPDQLEKTMTKQELADLLAFLKK